MSTRYNDGSHYENHQRAAELHDVAAHAHRVAEQQHAKQDRETGHEQSRQALEHSRTAFQHTQAAADQRGVHMFNHEDIAQRAYSLWQARGCTGGSPEEDWFLAAKELRSENAR